MPVREPRRKKRKRENQTSGGKNRSGAAPLLGHTAILKKNEKMKTRRTIHTHGEGEEEDSPGCPHLTMTMA